MALLLALLASTLGVALLASGCGTLPAATVPPEHPVEAPRVAPTPTPQRCVIARHPLDEATALTYVHQGHIYFFCSPECIELFKKDPQRYLEALVKSTR